jgi:hypothetical protein
VDLPTCLIVHVILCNIYQCNATSTYFPCCCWFSHISTFSSSLESPMVYGFTKHINMYHIMQILLPVLHHHHWSVYCVNFDPTRIDVVDPMHHTHECENWDKHHSELEKKIIHRLSGALSNAAPLKFKLFKNWRHVPVRGFLRYTIRPNGRTVVLSVFLYG